MYMFGSDSKNNDRQFTPSKTLSYMNSFQRNEDGSMTLFAIFMFFMMIIIAGLGVDLMRNELERTRIQNTLDRAVLAAADLDQELDPKAVVLDYLDKSGIDPDLALITVDQDEDFRNFRQVIATADATTPTQFMSLLGTDTLTSPTGSTAEERISNVEISLVLDISGSMATNNRIVNMRSAAKTFVNHVIREGAEDLISVSLVPYTAQTNAGQAIFNELNIQELHGYSYCVDFDNSDFSVTGLDLNAPYLHMQHFEKSSRDYFGGEIQNPGCPFRSFEEIQAISQNAEALNTTIDSYTARARTAIHLGMKWGVALLDPSFNPITEELNKQGAVDDVFKNRPVEYDDGDTLKTIVLMTDGENVDTYRIADVFYDSPSDRVHWNFNTLDRFLSRFVRQSNWPFWRSVRYSTSQANSALDNICSAAKSKGIIIWSVGFEVNDTAANVMRSCASSPSHFFRVEGVELTEAFESIASQINQLRLTQ